MTTAIKNTSNARLYSPPIQCQKFRHSTLNIKGDRIGTLTVLDSSLYRRLTALFWTIANNMWVSLGSLIGAHFRVRLENDDTNAIEAQPHMEGQPIYRAVDNLRMQTKLSSHTVNQYCEYLAKEYTAQYIPNCLVEVGLPTNVAKFPEPMHNKILIPIVLKDWPCDHIVTVYITRTAEGATIEFYDSKGLTIADRFNQKLVNNSQMTLGRLIAELSDRYCNGLTKDQITVEENTTKQQWDSHNCGVYVCHYLDARLRGTDTSTVYSTQVDYRHTFVWRTDMVNDLMPIFNQRVQEIASRQNMVPEDIDFPDEAEPPVSNATSVPTEDFLQTSIMEEVERFKRGVIVLPDDEEENVTEKQSVRPSHRQLSETLETRKIDTYTGLVNVPLD